MKKFIQIAIACFAVAFVGCNSNQKKDKNVVQDVKKTVEDPVPVDIASETYFITAPNGWTQLDTMIAGSKQTKMTSPLDGTGDKFSENINVKTEAASGYTVDSYVEANFESLKTEMPGVVIADQGTTTIDGIPAHCYTYSFEYSGLEIKDIGWFLMKNGIAYVITCTALKSTFDKFEPKFRACANTFKIK